MKKKNIGLFCFSLLGILSIVSCKKDSQNIFNMFNDVTVEYKGDHPLSVTDYKLVNDGDSVYIDYTITSEKEDMYQIVTEKVGGSSSNSPERSPFVIANEGERRSFSRVLKLKMQRDGKTSYRFYALNSKGTFIGDGYKKVTIEVNPSYVLVPDRRIFAPDTLTQVAPSFYSISRGQSFSYTDGLANSADIDFGIWRNRLPNANGNYTYHLYSLSNPTNPYPLYNISDWQKRGTKFSAPVRNGTNTFLYNLVSASSIRAAAIAANPNRTIITPTSPETGLFTNNIIYFITPEGKYGVFHVNQTTSDFNERPYLNISVKMEK